MGIIYGKRIRLRAPTRADIPQFVDWLNDDEVTAGLLLYLPMSLEDEEAWFEGMRQRPSYEHPMVIEVKTEDGQYQPIGNCGFHNLDWRVRTMEVGIFIGEKSLWNKGYGTEAMELILKHGFETMNMNRIYLQVFDNNPRAIRSYEKAGFVHEGRQRQAAYRGGHYFDVLLMSVLRSEYDARAAGG